MKIARRKRKLADAKRKSTMGRRRCLVVRKERRNGPSLFVRPFENGNYEMEKELGKSWGKMGDRRAETATESRREEEKEEEEEMVVLV